MEAGAIEATAELALSVPPEPEPAVLVRAAGGIVVRGTGGTTEVLLVHRPRYDDWSFPKGKQDPGESWEQTAVREVVEETGLRCRVGEFLDEVRYTDNRGRPKVVRYWVMHPEARPEEWPFRPNDEVDELRWCRSAEAATLLTYAHDRALLEHLERTS